MSNIFHLDESIRQEFFLDPTTGKVSTSRRGAARLAGVSNTAISKLLEQVQCVNPELPPSLQSFAGQSFEGVNLPDIFVAAIIEYYAFDAERYCTEQAFASLSRLCLNWLSCLGSVRMAVEPVIPPNPVSVGDRQSRFRYNQTVAHRSGYRNAVNEFLGIDPTC